MQYIRTYICSAHLNLLVCDHLMFTYINVHLNLVPVRQTRGWLSLACLFSEEGRPISCPVLCFFLQHICPVVCFFL